MGRRSASVVIHINRLLRKWKGDTGEGETKMRLSFRKRRGGGSRLYGACSRRWKTKGRGRV
jgi:hypothetical protein